MNLFIFDFDGTITAEDTTDLILEIPKEDKIWKIEEEWKQGKITSYQCMKRQARFLEGITIGRIFQHLRQHSRLDPSFHRIVRVLRAMNFHTVVLSEGYDLSARFHEVDRLIKNIYCSRLVVEDGRLTGELRVSNERRWGYNNECMGCCICKVDFLNQLRKKSNVGRSFAVGDGRSDECLFQHVDISFSLDPEYEATYQVRDLSDVLKTLTKYSGDEGNW